MALLAAVVVPIPDAAQAAGPATLEISGMVSSGAEALAGARVTVYSSSDGQGSKVLGQAETDAEGSFAITYRAPSSSDGVVYLTTRGGDLSTSGLSVPDAFVLATVIGSPSNGQTVMVNDLTTVASAFAMAQFIRGRKMRGSSPGIQLASQMIGHLVDIETGVLGATITNDSNGDNGTSINRLNEMANLLASCATEPGVCDDLLSLALPLSGSAPRDTFRAVANMAANPWQNTAEIYALVDSDLYQPALDAAPAGWTLSLKFKGNPDEFAGPGNIAIDKDGQLWVGNNYVHESGFILPDCASDQLFRLDPTSGDTTTFTGGGVDGVGFGITIDPDGDIWTGNFGFKGTTCQRTPFSDSVSQFASDGTPISPNMQWTPGTDAVIVGGGWTQGDISWPQGTVSNRDGDIWIANCGANSSSDTGSLTVYRDGDPDDWFVIEDERLDKPFDIAFNTSGNAWVTSTNSDQVFAFDPNGNALRGSPWDLPSGSRPMGIASDSRGYVWVSVSGRIELPCPDERNQTPPSMAPAVALFNERGERSPAGGFTGGGLTIPWGIAVDGADTVWVANFEKGGLTNFCGTRTSGCPSGLSTGDPISPDITGYTSALLDRNTGVAVDSSGNVWLTNNWKDLPIQINPAGDGLVVYIGLASPVLTPGIGPPRRP
jgi:streptogramin lyase